MPSPDRRQVTLRETYAASLYGFDSEFRRDDAFGHALADICAAALAADAYDDATVDIFTGDGFLTVCGTARPRVALARVHAVVTRHPRRRFHSLDVFPGGPDTADGLRPGAWAGATLFTPNGAVLGSLDLWSAAPVRHGEATHALLPVLARAAMHVLDERRRIWSARAVPTPGPRAVVERRVDPTSGPGDAPV